MALKAGVRRMSPPELRSNLSFHIIHLFDEALFPASFRKAPSIVSLR